MMMILLRKSVVGQWLFVVSVIDFCCEFQYQYYHHCCCDHWFKKKRMTTDATTLSVAKLTKRLIKSWGCTKTSAKVDFD